MKQEDNRYLQTDDFSDISIDDIKKALGNTCVYLFRFFPKERILVNSDAICSSFKCSKVMYDIPKSFCDEYVYESDRNVFYRIYEDIINNKPVSSGEFRLKKAVAWCRITLTTTKWDEDNKPEMCVGVFENRSDIFTMENQLRQDNALTLEKRGIGTWRWENEPGRKLRLYLDKIARNFFAVPEGMTPEDTLNLVDKRIHPEDEQAFREYSASIVNGKQGEHIYRIVHPEKGIRYIRCNAWYDKDYKGYGCIKGIHDDVTEQVVEEEKQKQALINAFEAAKRANIAKTAFLSNMSHDIRTPMNAIVGFANIASEHIDDTEKVRNCLDKIKTSSEHLQGLINKILDMSRIESGKITLELSETSLSELSQSIISMIMPQVKLKQLNLNIDTEKITDDYVMADALRLRQILINILGNAVKFTDNGGNIDFTVSQLEKNASGYGLYRFSVKDNGIGISEEFQSRIFEPFEREKTSTVSGITGTGLGMAITKSLVDMMNGKIKVKSKKGEGCEFIIDLELKLQQGKCSGNEACEVSDSDAENIEFSGERILLVEDNELNRELATEILSEAGFEIDTAVNGREAVDTLMNSAENYYRLVLMDIQMPVMNGYDATVEIRKMSRSDIKNIPVIAMTANAFAEDVEASVMAGMNDHIAKPFDIKKLLNLIKKYL